MDSTSDGFGRLVGLAIDTACSLFEAHAVEPAPAMDLRRFRSVATGASNGERAIPPGPCPMPAAETAIPSKTTLATEALVQAMRSSMSALNWFRSDKVPNDFMARSCAAELVGPDGAHRCDEMRFGLFLIAASANYPQHWHGAHENYLVLAGSGYWELDDAWVSHSAGDVIAVPSLQPHALRTADTGLLMLYTWTGDITYDRYGVG